MIYNQRAHTCQLPRRWVRSEETLCCILEQLHCVSIRQVVWQCLGPLSTPLRAEVQERLNRFLSLLRHDALYGRHQAPRPGCCTHYLGSHLRAPFMCLSNYTSPGMMLPQGQQKKQAQDANAQKGCLQGLNSKDMLDSIDRHHHATKSCSTRALCISMALTLVMFVHVSNCEATS